MSDPMYRACDIYRGNISKSTAPEALLTVAEVAAELRLSVKTVRRMIARGELPGRQIGRQWRVRRTHLDAVIRGSM